MNMYLSAAGVLALIVGVVHSVLGELRIFSRLRRGSIIPTHGGDLLQQSNVRILWASWHVLTVFGWGLAAMLLWLALPSSPPQPFITQSITVSMLAGSALVLVGTRARHPGWVGLLGVAVLVWLGTGAA